MMDNKFNYIMKFRAKKGNKSKKLYESKEDFIYMILFITLFIIVIIGLIIGSSNLYEVSVDNRSKYENLIYTVEDKEGQVIIKNYIDSDTNKIMFYLKDKDTKDMRIKIYDSFEFPTDKYIYSESLDSFKNKRKIVIRN